mmetsp:Transcript_17390/g.42244  ORF Transcript_17390/g.42244 Transcript_17390/m.42244 type:complete len:90 (-) Transcript_17390:821-1090(-)
MIGPPPPPPSPCDPPVGQTKPEKSSGSSSNVSKKTKSVSFNPSVGNGTNKVRWLQVEQKLQEVKTIEEAGKIVLHTMTDSSHKHLREKW